MNEDIQNITQNMGDGAPSPFEGKLDISHVVSVIMDHIGGVVRIPAAKFTESLTVDRRLVLEYDNESQDFILTVESGLIGQENLDEQPSN
jgi:hypothetical protein